MKILMTILLSFPLLCIGTLCAGDAGGYGATVFTDVTATHVPLAPGLHALDAVMVDVNGDGHLDVVVAVEYGANRLYMNDGKGRLTHRPGVFDDRRNDNEHVRARTSMATA